MSVLLDRTNRVLVQGITGQMARFSVVDMRAYGTNIVAGVVPGRQGDSDGIPIFPDVATACRETGADTSIAYIPGNVSRGGVLEAIEAGCKLVVYPGDQIPIRDAMEMRSVARANRCTLIGPNTAGLISPGKAKLGFMPSFCYAEGNLGVISKSGSLSYEVCQRLTRAGIGQTTVIGIGGDPIKGLTAIEAIDLLHADPYTLAILVIGEIGGADEYAAAEYASRADAKPVAALIVGRTAPLGKRMGHAGALINNRFETYDAKLRGLADAGIDVAETLSEVEKVVNFAINRSSRSSMRIRAETLG